MTSDLPPLEIPETSKPTGRLRATLIYLSISLIGGGMGFVLSRTLTETATRNSGDESVGLITLIAIIPIFFLCITIHELGHVIAGLIGRFQFYSIQVGPFRLSRTPQGFKFDTQWALAFMGGMAVTYPTDTNDLACRALWYYAGGPLASFLSFGVALLTFLITKGWPGTTIDVMGNDILFLFFIGNSLLISILTMIPNRTMGITSDGARIFTLVFNKAEAQRDLALFALFGLSHSGMRPRDWDSEWIEKALSIDEQTLLTAVGHGFAYAKALDEERYADARTHLQDALNALESNNLNYRPSLIIEAVYFEAAVRKDLSSARRWHDELPAKAQIEPTREHRANAAIFALEGKPSLARTRILAAREALQQSLDQGGKLAEEALLERIELSIS